MNKISLSIIQKAQFIDQKSDEGISIALDDKYCFDSVLFKYSFLFICLRRMLENTLKAKSQIYKKEENDQRMHEYDQRMHEYDLQRRNHKDVETLSFKDGSRGTPKK